MYLDALFFVGCLATLPTLPFRLSDQEIFADLTLISKAQHQNVRKATQAFKNRK
ncbi:hypothetical protein HK105_205610 [Polyrhizophydium stewartii]|uniref:Uncharacterized protein n=1 Tax=Polyrhizophydium stewartii TaxID=2732419 RepID=A0ABR4N5P0_9FUNG